MTYCMLMFYYNDFFFRLHQSIKVISNYIIILELSFEFE